MSKFFKCFERVDPSVTDDIRIYFLSKYNPLSPIEDVREINLDKLTVSSVKACTYCRVTFSDTTEQRAHYKLDWHRYNLKQALLSRPSISAEDFDNTVDDVSSISGSESESSEDTDAEDGPPSYIQDARLYWENSHSNVFSIFKCLLLNRRETASTLQLQINLSKFFTVPHKWLIVMLGGGHFAAAVFDGGSVIVHKTFHSYTVRAKQGGGQASRDSRGGSHPKSAGASLRRYNELSLVQHVQSIMSSWSSDVETCSLIFFRAVGPHNRSVVFGGKNPPIIKNDPRVRPIPFPTRRATFKEVKRIHDLLSNVTCHGSISEFEKEAAASKREKSPSGSNAANKNTKSPKKPDRTKERLPQHREVPGEEFTNDSSESDDVQEFTLCDAEIDLTDLKEHDNTLKKKKKRRKFTTRQRTNQNMKKFTEAMNSLRAELIDCCQNGNDVQLQELIAIAEQWPSRPDPSSESGLQKPEDIATLHREDFWKCLRGPVCLESQDSLLHIAARHCQPMIVSALLNADCDPSIKNKNKLPPYVLAGDKTTKNAFKEFISAFPNKYDAKLAMIPPVLTEEQQILKNEKKKERKRHQKEREKIKKKEAEQRKIDEDDKIRFLALSDREKRALAAERRLIKSVESNCSKAAVPVLVRCFLCGVNITGKVPFEYNTQLFCTITCLKTHRANNNSYSAKI